MIRTPESHPCRRRHPVALVAVALLAGCGVGGPAYVEPSDGIAATVVMTTALAFDPSEVTVRVGDTVEWRNKSILTHTVTTDPTIVRDTSNVEIPEGAMVFDSGAVFPGEIFRYTFRAPGTYRYVSLPHESFAMHGTVVVEAQE